MENDKNKKCMAEAVATFALVFAGTGAIVINDLYGGVVTHVGVSLTFGLVVMSMVYAFGEFSGAHMNPAVTIGFWLSRRFPGKMVIAYILSQIAGALLASLTLRLLFDHPTLGATIPDGALYKSFVIEVIITFMLVIVILRVSTGSKETGMMAGIAIGSVIALAALFAGPVSGASMNPARSLGPALVSGELAHAWLYIVAPVIGASLAVLACRTLDNCNRQLPGTE